MFLSGAADPCLVGSYNEYLQLSEYGMNVDSIYSIRLADYGYNLPEDGLYVTEEFYNQYPEVVRDQDSFFVTTNDGSEFDAKVVGVDPPSDLALTG